MTSLAIEGGTPVRRTVLPYGRHWIDESDVDSVISALRSDWLTTGPLVSEFEAALAETTGASDAIAVSSGTAALHSAMFALGLGSGDEVIVPALTFAATANCVRYLGGFPVFADVDPETLLLDPKSVDKLISPRTRAVIAVDYAGQPCDYEALRAICDQHKITLVADACHSLGGSFNGQSVGTLADLTCFSFHPVKHITTGEGGAVTTADQEFSSRIRRFRNHGIDTDHRQRDKVGSWSYEMQDLGYNYRMTDIQCALGMSQLPKLGEWVERRRRIAARYDEAFGATETLRLQRLDTRASHARHLYVVRLDLGRLRTGRSQMFAALRAEGIGVNVHYIPVHLHPYYQKELGTRPGDCPVSESAYEELLSLPMFPAMSERDVVDVIEALTKVTTAYGF